MSEQIDPDHYKNKNIETFYAITSQLPPVQVIGFLRGQIMKYIMRLGSKHDDSVDAMLMDAGKVDWYLSKLMQYLNDHKDKIDG